MADPEITAFIVPHGKVLDFIDGTIRNETPEEYVRQEIEKSLVREYLYPPRGGAGRVPDQDGSHHEARRHRYLP